MAFALKYLIQLLAVGAVYFLLVRLGLDLTSVYPGATAISAPAGFALGAVLVGGYRIVPAILAAAYLANPTSSDASHAAAVAAAGAFTALVGALLADGWAEGRNAFTVPTGIARFVLVAIVTAGIGATFGLILNPDLAGNLNLATSARVALIDWEKLTSLWFPRWLADLGAILMITPALVLWIVERPRSIDLPSLAESAAIFLAAGVLAVLAFTPLTLAPGATALTVLIVLPPMWAALRRGPRDTATASLIIMGFAGLGTLFGGGPFAASAGADRLLVMLMIAIASPSLVLAADVAQRRRTERRLQEVLSELGQAREQFAQSQKMEAVGQLTGGVAHDFNNLLTVIVGNLTIAQRHLESLTEAPAERLRRAVNNAMRGAERATTITKHLLVFSRKQPIDPRSLDIHDLVRGLSDFLRRSLGETITLDIIAADDLWPAKADSVQLEAAILNLAVNARDAMAAGGKLTIAIENQFLDAEYCRQHNDIVAGPYVRIAVKDTGVGMPKDVRERVFEPFFTTKKAGQGTGLGLAQVYGFVKQLNGHIEIDSAPGQGTTISLYLPALPGHSQEKLTAEPHLAAIGATPTILLVEDDHDVRGYVVDILRELHYRVLEAHDADSALALLDRNDVQVDLLLSDLVLPGMNGGQLAEEVKARQPRVKILLMTGYSRDAVRDQWPIDPDIGMLHKPLSEDALEQKVREVLDQPDWSAAAEPSLTRERAQ